MGPRVDKSVVLRQIALALAMGIVWASCFVLEVKPLRSTPWPHYIALALLGGAVMIVLEVAGGSLVESHLTTDSPLRRAGRMGGVLAVLGVAGGLFWVITHVT